MADVELPNHVSFTQCVLRMRRCAMTVVLDDAGELLLMRRHRFIVDRWVWELPGGYVDDGEDSRVAAAREVEEGTGGHPHGVEFVMSCQPFSGNADTTRRTCTWRAGPSLSQSRTRTRRPKSGGCRSETPEMIARGGILGATTIIGVQHALLRRAAARHRRPTA